MKPHLETDWTDIGSIKLRIDRVESIPEMNNWLTKHRADIDALGEYRSEIYQYVNVRVKQLAREVR